jgi:hypothetical protein
MTSKRNLLALALTLGLSLGAATGARAVTVAGSSITTTRPAEAETLTSGVITSIEAARGVLVVSGRVIHFTPKGVTYSDDRRKPPHNGLEGLKAGDKVTVRSVMRGGSIQAIQIVVKD